MLLKKAMESEELEAARKDLRQRNGARKKRLVNLLNEIGIVVRDGLCT